MATGKRKDNDPQDIVNKRKKLKEMEGQRPAPPARRSARTNKGEGGLNVQREAISKLVQAPSQKSRSNAQDIPDTAMINPMAPEKQKRGRKKKTETSSLTRPQIPVPMTHIVPPGTEPSLQPAVSNSRFGFRSADSSHSYNNPTALSFHPLSQAHIPIDPALLAQSTHPPTHQGYTGTPASIDINPTHHFTQPEVHRQSNGGATARRSKSGSQPRVPYAPQNPLESHPKEHHLPNSGLRSASSQVHPRPHPLSHATHSRSNLTSKRDTYPGNGSESSSSESSNEESNSRDGTEETDEDPDALLAPGFDRSDDEDERLAQAQLRYVPQDKDNNWSTTQQKGKGKAKQASARVPAAGNYLEQGIASKEPNAEADRPFDVLADHHKRNRAPCAPDPRRLNNIREASRSTSHGSHAATSTIPEMQEDESDADEEMNLVRAKRHSKTPYGGKQALPTQMLFYPSQWRDVLEQAKWRFRLWLTTKCPFPHREKDIGEAEDCINEALAEHEEDGGRVEPGYLEHHMRDMRTLVWEDGSTFRGDLKTKARGIVSQQYDLFPPSSDNQKAFVNHVKKAVKALVASGVFLRGGLDDQGRTNNFGHPALKMLCLTFYYVGKNQIASQFPDEFRDQVPRLAIVLAATAINCALDEWKTGQRKTIKFSAAAYRKVFKAMVTVMENVETDLYHGRKFLQLRTEWAREGCMATGEDTDDTDGELGFVACLD